MAQRNYGYSRSAWGRGGGTPFAVKWLLISNVAIYLLFALTTRFGGDGFFSHFALVPGMVIGFPAPWQLATYMFLHDPGGIGHILFNMLSLWMFGCDLERDWGSKKFLQYYFLCGIGAGISVVIASMLFGGMNVPTIGASGAIYGILMAYGVLYPDRILLMNFLFPIKAKYFVMIVGAIAFMQSILASGSGVSHVAHLGGLIFGFLYLRSKMLKGRDPLAFATAWYRNWKIERNRKKFQVYMRKQNGPDRWIH